MHFIIVIHEMQSSQIDVCSIMLFLNGALLLLFWQQTPTFFPKERWKR
jgi:hypothetical protein